MATGAIVEVVLSGCGHERCRRTSIFDEHTEAPVELGSVVQAG